jgi:hypothetical protein
MIKNIDGMLPLREVVAETTLDNNIKLELSISNSYFPIIINTQNKKIFSLNWDELVEQAIQSGILDAKDCPKIESLKVFEFDNGETDCVIAEDELSARDWYLRNIADDLEEYTITEIKDWHKEIVYLEEKELQADGNYRDCQTMLEVAREIYKKGYTEPTIISTSCIG